MLYILVGVDFLKIKKRISEIAKGYELVRFGENAEPFSSATLRLGAVGLFSPKVALHLDKPLENTEGKEIFLEHIKAFANAEMPVIATAISLDAETKKKIPKNAGLEVFEDEKTADVPAHNTFALTDAYLKNDRKQMWVLYRKFIEAGISAEEIHGVLSWQVRALVLAAKAKNATEAGLKPFVYTKAKTALSNVPVSPEETSRELVSLYHRSRAGEGTLEDLLEMFLLKKA
jgi:DNA polymerase III delta subunit